MLNKNRFLLTSLGAVSLIAAISFLPSLTFAATSIITNLSATPDPFYTQIPKASTTPLINLDYKYNSGGYPSADITEQIKDKNGTVVYEFQNPGADTTLIKDPLNFNTVTKTWDGKYNIGSMSGQYVPDGTYTFYVKSHVAEGPDSEAGKTFTVAKAVAPKLTLLSNSPVVFYNSTDNKFTLNFNINIGSGNLPVVRLKVSGPNDKTPVSIPIIENAIVDNGNFSIIWDGKVSGNQSPAGDYSFALDATTNVNNYLVNSDTLTGNFKIVNSIPPKPSVSDISASPLPFDPSKTALKINYKLSGSLGYTTINAAVYKNNDTENPVKNFKITNQATGANSITWDGKDDKGALVSNGNYVIKVWGEDGYYSIVPEQINFDLSASGAGTQQTVEVADQCSGFTDFSKGDPDCEAAAYVKSIGAMTGNPDGSFNPDGLLQRDQVAKIVLLTFNLYNRQTDYCQSKSPFPDVTPETWSYQYVCRGVSLGTITGYLSGADKGMYKPAQTVNRAEFLALVLRNIDENMPDKNNLSYADITPGAWYGGFAKYSRDHNLFTGGDLNPSNFVTRREVAAILYKLHKLAKI